MSQAVVRFLGKLLINALALIVAAVLVPRFNLNWDGPNGFIYVVLVASILVLINTFLRPIAKMASLPLNLLTLGLFGIVLNGLLILLLAFAAGQLQGDLGIGGKHHALQLAGFPPNLSVDAIVAAILGAIVISIVSTILAIFIPD